MRCKLLLIVLCLSVVAKSQAKDQNKAPVKAEAKDPAKVKAKTYRAAVVTLPGRDVFIPGEKPPPPTDRQLTQLIEENVRIYERYIADAGKQKVDILVLPEGTLNYFGMPTREHARRFAIELPSASDGIAPCDDPKYHQVLSRLCKAVRKAKVYTVVNVVERVDCRRFKNLCGTDNVDTNAFNTNIVFNREGKIIARYRKINVFTEPLMDIPREIPRQSEIVPFNTDFGESFFTIICFDLIFKTPTMDVIASGAHNIILSTMWFSKTPFLVATEAQMGVAIAAKVNLLASCGAWIPHGAAGSGIYSPEQGPLQMSISDPGEGMMLVADVPKITRTNSAVTYGNLDGTNVPLKNQKSWFNDELTQLNISQHAFAKNVQFQPLKREHKVCPSPKGATVENCCQYKVDYELLKLKSGATGYDYYFASFYGVRKWGGNRYLNELYCAVIACSGTNPVEHCGKRYNSTTIYKTVNFKSIDITMTTKTEKNDQFLENVFIMPSTLEFDMLPLRQNQYTFKSEIQQKTKLSSMSTRNNGELFTFGFYGRNFNEDLPAGVVPGGRRPSGPKG